MFNDPEKDRKSTQDRGDSRPGWRQAGEGRERSIDKNRELETDREERPDESADEEES